MRRKIRHLKPRIRRSIRIKAKIVGKTDRLRLSIFRSNRYIYCQIVDDSKKKTVISAGEKELNLPKEKKLTKSEKAKMVGQLIAAKAKKEKIEKIDDYNFVVYTKELPVEGRANKAIIEILAEYFHIASSNIKIVSGYNSKRKTIEIE